MEKKSSELPDFVKKIVDIIAPFMQGYLISCVFNILFLSFLLYFIAPGIVAVGISQDWQNLKGYIGISFILILCTFPFNFLSLMQLHYFQQKKYTKKEIVKLLVAIFWFVYPITSVVIDCAFRNEVGLQTIVESGTFKFYPMVLLLYIFLNLIFQWINHPQVVFFSVFFGILLFVLTYCFASKVRPYFLKRIRK